MSIARISEFHALKGKSEELYIFLGSMMSYITSSQGCISCEVLRNKDDAESFVVIEKWETVECHIMSVKEFPKDKMNEAMCLLGGPPRGNYFHQ